MSKNVYYKVIYCDALYTNLKPGNSYSKEAVHIIYGVKDDNTKRATSTRDQPNRKR
ncbi:MAG: hypothetical protein AAF770_02765 [Bacteroidota bacterium]